MENKYVEIVEKIKKDFKANIYFESKTGILLCGNCKDILNKLPDKSIDLVLTDPPYGIERFKKGKTRIAKDEEYKNGIFWDKKPEKEIFDEIFRVSKYQIIWGMNNFNLPTTEYFFVWDKYQTVDNFSSAEIAYTNLKCPAKVYRYPIHLHNKSKKFHPTQKPVSLFVFCLNYAYNCYVVLDPYLGSGTTALACIKTGRKWIGIELLEKYCEIAKERILQEENNIF